MGAYGFPCPQNPSGLWAISQRLGAWTGQTYEEFVSQILLPLVPKGSVLVMDNARIHHRTTLRELVETAGCHILYLPPYSPDFNPIELLWSWFKDNVRKQAPRTDDLRQIAIQNAAQGVPDSAAEG